jgi:hypothetical protein
MHVSGLPEITLLCKKRLFPVEMTLLVRWPADKPLLTDQVPAGCRMLNI